MTKERIQILVDTSRDTGWSNGLIRIEPDNIYQTTNNREYLSEAVLKNYDVLTICNSTALKYTNAELQLIHEFVENGGGLFLSASTSRFERDVREPISELGINQVASLFGAQFLPLPEGQGEMDTDANPLRGYAKKDLCFTNHEITDGLGIDDLGLTYCGILDIPAEGGVFLEHCETKEPVGACLDFGSGRVLLINTQLFQWENHPVSGRFIDWLGTNREETPQQKPSLTMDTQTIPDEIPIDEQVREDGKIKVFYTRFVEDRVDTCMAFAKKLAEEMLSKFPDSEKIDWKIDLIPSCVHKYGSNWEDSVMTIGACVNPARLAYSLGVEASGLLAEKTPFGKASDVLFDGYQFFFGIWAMKLLGFEREAAMMVAEAERQFHENADEKLVDVAKIYEQRSRKPIWILKVLLEKYGDELFVRLTEVFSEKDSDTEENMPHPTFSRVNRQIYYLSRAVGEDLFPWFEENGTTVHPLPLLPNDSDEFAAEIRGYLNTIIRDTSIDTSDRIDAIDSLLEITDDAEHQISACRDEATSPLHTADRYERLIAAAKLIRSCDDRAVKVLEALTVETGDDGLVAMTVLMLVHNSRGGEIADRLAEIAPHHDHRYQLETGYLLAKIGHPAAEAFSYKKLTDENGTRLLTMDVKRNAELYHYPIIADDRVAICNVILHTHHFPHNTHAPGTYVSWVHTTPKYRRKGIARRAFGASMSHELVRRYSCISLHTGTDNNAHGMYRNFGFVDGLLGRQFTKALRDEQTKVVEDLVVRPYRHGDEVAMASVCNAFYVDQVALRPRHAERRRTTETRLIYLAEKDRELFGYVQAQCFEKEKNVSITEFCLKTQPPEDSKHPEGFLEDVGAAMLCALHNELVKREYKKIKWGFEGEAENSYARMLFHNFGYTSEDAGWVWMFKIVNLPMLLGELSPLLLKRLNESDDYKGWQGTISIKGSEHRASLIIKDGEIRVSEEVSEATGICLSTDDDTITRFILGVITPYGAYLQNQLHIAPTVNSSVTRLLGTLFPSHQR
ncbi:MAG: GNAT family N-acetyltransferase [Candidatus Poribacteria bacterium]|nr:GNAT family N-acetyltransferase [Candidatus Poribacteria bacterium]